MSSVSEPLSSGPPAATGPPDAFDPDVFDPDGRRVCPIADALTVIGDRWTLLTVRELNLGVSRFNDIQTATGAPRASLAARLRQLEGAGLVERRRYQDHPPRDEYALTPAGQELAPALRELRDWGLRHGRNANPAQG